MQSGFCKSARSDPVAAAERCLLKTGEDFNMMLRQQNEDILQSAMIDRMALQCGV